MNSFKSSIVLHVRSLHRSYHQCRTLITDNSRVGRKSFVVHNAPNSITGPPRHTHCYVGLRRDFHNSQRAHVVRSFLLADIGEGITECQLIQWFVQPGARVEQFDKLCEVQSDKASVEITSPFDGVIRRLHYEPDDMAFTGKPLVDIDVQADDSSKQGHDATLSDTPKPPGREQTPLLAEADASESSTSPQIEAKERTQYQLTLATPAVRHLTKQLGVEITELQGTGRDGRVTKDDVQRFVAQRDCNIQAPTALSIPTPPKHDRKVALTPVQNQMFKVMTRSLNIPQFLYTCAADMTAVTATRNTLNTTAPSNLHPKITSLAFIIKAISIAFLHHPILNASLEATDLTRPELTYHSAHHFGLAIDTRAGLLVPVIRNVQDQSISSIAVAIHDLSDAARTNKLTADQFAGATFTISNIGSIGGGVVSPIVSEPQVAVVGIGRSKVVPAFDDRGKLVKREELVLSWSADHRVINGAECARCAEEVKSLLEQPGKMLVQMQ